MKYNVKMACIFHLILVSILSILTLSVKNRGWFFFLLNRQNPLSMTEVICRQTLKTFIKLVLISSELKFNFESSNFNVEVLRTRFPCQGLLDFLRILFFLKKSEIWAKYGQWCYCFKFLKKIRLDWLFYVGFGEIRFSRWHGVISSNSWFLTILKAFILPLFKLFFS